jgi:hypothetical protein
MWCWRRMEISRTDHVTTEEMLQRVEEVRNILQKTKIRKANWVGHILRGNCLLKHVIEGKIKARIKVTGRRGRRHKQLLDDFKERAGYWKLKEEALDRTIWRIVLGRGYGRVVRHTTVRRSLLKAKFQIEHHQGSILTLTRTVIMFSTCR